MYEDLYSPLPDVAAYMKRIGLESQPLEPNMELLCKIIPAQLAHIPFENLDAFCQAKTPALGVPSLFEKIILGRRGGWCFELNGLLHALLCALGYDAYNVGVRVTVGNNHHALVLHRGVIVRLDGEKYYCDVGFGTIAIPQPIPLSGGTTPAGFCARLVDGDYRIYQGDNYLLRFEDRPYRPEDYIPANFFTSQNTDTPFRKRMSISIQNGDTRYQLLDYTVKELEKGQLVNSVTAADNAELSALLEKYFGIEYKL